MYVVDPPCAFPRRPIRMRSLVVLREPGVDGAALARLALRQAVGQLDAHRQRALVHKLVGESEGEGAQ